MKKLIILLLVLLSGSAYSQNLYGGFESWRSYTVITAPATTLQSPFNWNTADSILFYAKGIFPAANFTRQVYKTTDAHSGSYAAKLITQHEDTFGVIPALLTNAAIELDLSTFDPANPAGSIIFSGGTHVSARIPAVSAWVKYYPKDNDTGAIYVLAMRSGIGAGGSDSMIGIGQVLFGNTIANYTKFSIPITYSDTSKPDFIQVIVTSGGGGNATPVDSSTLYVDDINVITTEVGELTKAADCTLYPNPVNSVLNISGVDVYKVNIYDILGRQVYSAIRPHSIDLSQQSPGIFYVQFIDENGTVNKLEKITKQ